jgi:hypothetical protein
VFEWERDLFAAASSRVGGERHVGGARDGMRTRERARERDEDARARAQWHV